MRPVVGHRFSLDMGAWGQQPCEVTAVGPPRLLAYTFIGGSLDTTITWRRAPEPEGTGTRLFLEHEGFDLDSPTGPQAADGMGAGWPGALARIGGALDVAEVTGDSGKDSLRLARVSRDPRLAVETE